MMTDRNFDILLMGRSSIDLYANDIGAPFHEIKNFASYVGGCPTNISVGTRRLGLRSVLLTAGGGDPGGGFFLPFLQAGGNVPRFLSTKTGRGPTGGRSFIAAPEKIPPLSHPAT